MRARGTLPQDYRSNDEPQVNISCGVIVALVCVVFVLLMRRRRVLLHV